MKNNLFNKIRLVLTTVALALSLSFLTACSEADVAIDNTTTKTIEAVSNTEATTQAEPTQPETTTEDVSTTETPTTTEIVTTTETPTTTEVATTTEQPSDTADKPFIARTEIILAEIDKYSGSPYIEFDGNVPLFLDKELTTTSYEYYSDLDSLGRCGMACACIGQDLMPTEDRGSIGQIKPSGWHTVKYDVVDGKYLYNRCHLIGYQLTAENANEKNLITGTSTPNNK